MDLLQKALSIGNNIKSFGKKKKDQLQQVINFSIPVAKTLGSYTKNAATQVANSGNFISQGLAKTKFFSPVQNKVRVRDVVREVPGGVSEAAKGLAQGATRFGLSLFEAPKTFKTGQASGRFYETPVGRINSFQSEAQNRMRRGDSFFKSVANPALDTILGGSDLGALTPALRSAQNSAKFSPEVRRIITDLFSPVTKNGIQWKPPKTESIPEHYQPAGWRQVGHREDGDHVLPEIKGNERFVGKVEEKGIDPVTKAPRLFIRVEKKVPAQTVSRGENIPSSNLFRALSSGRAGLSVEDVTKGAAKYDEKGGRHLTEIENADLETSELKKKLLQLIEGNDDPDLIEQTTKDLAKRLDEEGGGKWVPEKEPDAPRAVDAEIERVKKEGEPEMRPVVKPEDIQPRVLAPKTAEQIIAKADALPSTKRPVATKNEGNSTPLLTSGKTQEPLALPQGRQVARTPAEARKIIQETGQVPILDFQAKPRTKPMELPEKPSPMSPRQALAFFKKTGEAPNFKTIKKGEDLIIPRPDVDSMEKKGFADVEEILYGNKAFEGAQEGRKGTGIIGSALRAAEDSTNEVLSKMLASPNVAYRTIANTLRGFMGTLGKSQDLQRATAAYKGEIDYGQKLAADTQKTVYELVNNDEQALKRIHSNLDPELYGGKVEPLNENEQEAANLLRDLSDFINDTNYKNGFISEEKWLQNRGGKYITRAYEEYDYPPEVASFVKQANAKFDMNPFKKREDLNEWKIEQSIKDPGYLVAKRLQQTVFNDSVQKMFSWLRGSQFVSDEARPGFTQVSDHKAYGDLAGKFVRKDVMEDIKGLFFDHDVAQKAYDVLNWYDRNMLRRGLKKSKTIYNPTVRLGNRLGNLTFAWLNGINPASFVKNQSWASGAIKKNDPLYLRAVKDGLMGTGSHRSDIIGFAQELKKGVEDKNILSRIDDALSESYGAVDDAAKLGALKTWLDRGLSYDEAFRKVQRGFQNYNTVGFLYDIGAKVPIFGNAFVRFQGSLINQLKNAVVDNPVRSFGTLFALKLMGDASSLLSGEDPADREIREGRVGAPHIPFTDIPLAFQTPWGEVNAARMLGVYANTPVGGATTGSDLSKMLPFQKPEVRNLGSDPLIGPAIAIATDTDFRGKSIADPEQNKWTGSTITDEEKNINRLQYLARSYNFPFVSAGVDVVSALQGVKDFYGREKSPVQAALNLIGVKVEQFGSEEAAAQRQKNLSFEKGKNEDIDKKISTIRKQFREGEITSEQAQNRINAFEAKRAEASEGATQVKDVSDVISLYELEKFTQPGDLSGIKKYTFEADKVAEARKIFEGTDKYETLTDEQKEGVFQAFGFNSEDVEYDYMAYQPDDAKASFLNDQMNAQGLDHNGVVQALLGFRQESIGGRRLASDGVLDELYHMGVISDAEKKALKKVRINKTGSMESTAGTGTGKGKKASQTEMNKLIKDIMAGPDLPKTSKASTARSAQPKPVKVALPSVDPTLRTNVTPPKVPTAEDVIRAVESGSFKPSYAEARRQVEAVRGGGSSSKAPVKLSQSFFRGGRA